MTHRQHAHCNISRHHVCCTDVMGRERLINLVPLAHHGVGIQPPPGEWFELDSEQLRDLLTAARDALRESRENHDPGPRTIIVGGPCP